MTTGSYTAVSSHATAAVTIGFDPERDHEASMGGTRGSMNEPVPLPAMSSRRATATAQTLTMRRYAGSAVVAEPPAPPRTVPVPAPLKNARTE
jgi:hypothetical protein